MYICIQTFRLGGLWEQVDVYCHVHICMCFLILVYLITHLIGPMGMEVGTVSYPVIGD